MNIASIDLSFIWAFVILIGIAVYIVADGFDLGVGILLPFIKNDATQDEFIDTVAAVWDGNETWLILGGAALMGAFPLAYAIIFEAFTIPIVVMLFALILRGVAFEFRVHSPKGHKRIWTWSFIIGSYVATLMQGMMAGAFLEGFVVNIVPEGSHFAGNQWDWVSPFSLLTGFGLVVMFALLGSFWGRMKGHDELRGFLATKIKPMIVGLVIVLLAILAAMFYSSKLMPLLVGARLYLVLASMIVIGLILLLLWCRSSMRDGARFSWTVFIMICGMIGYTSLFFPYIIPPSITLDMAASAASSQMFGLVGTLIMLPIIIFYLAWTYYIFRGKVVAGHGY